MKNTILLLSLCTAVFMGTGVSNANSSNVLESKISAIDEVTVQGGKLFCLDDDITMKDCLSFIKGFLQGALLTDTAIIKSIKEAEPSYAERAFRTRLGKRSSPTALAGFCLPEDRSILDIAEETLDHVKGSERNSAELAKNVYSSLKKDYPCE